MVFYHWLRFTTFWSVLIFHPTEGRRLSWFNLFYPIFSLGWAACNRLFNTEAVLNLAKCASRPKEAKVTATVHCGACD